jgi:hypothetical protein
MERRELIQILAATSALGQAAPYAPRFLTAAEYGHLEQLALTLLPEEPGSPGAKSANVSRYIDTILVYSDSAAQSEWRKGLAILKPDDFIKVAAAELSPKTEAERFFVTLKRLVLEAFSQSPAAAEFYGYRGNTAIRDFPGCSPASKQIPKPHRH